MSSCKRVRVQTQARVQEFSFRPPSDPALKHIWTQRIQFGREGIQWIFNPVLTRIQIQTAMGRPASQHNSARKLEYCKSSLTNFAIRFMAKEDLVIPSKAGPFAASLMWRLCSKRKYQRNMYLSVALCARTSFWILYTATCLIS